MQGLSLKQVVTHHIGPIDLSLSPQERVGISGESGAGKSLLLRAIADLDPHQGTISLHGTEQAQLPAHQWRSRVAYIAAESHWWGDQVKDHFATEQSGEIELWLARAGFNHETVNWEIQRLSTGEKQRLAIVRQLIRQPEALLLDEPTASLDSANIQRIEEMLLQYQQQQRAPLLWVSHDQEQLSRVCNRQYRLQAGQLRPAT